MKTNNKLNNHNDANIDSVNEQYLYGEHWIIKFLVKTIEKRNPEVKFASCPSRYNLELILSIKNQEKKSSYVKNCLYVENKGNYLMYKIKNEWNEIVSGGIDYKMLGKDFPSDWRTVRDIESREYLTKILKVTSERGHTLPEKIEIQDSLFTDISVLKLEAALVLNGSHPFVISANGRTLTLIQSIKQPNDDYDIYSSPERIFRIVFKQIEKWNAQGGNTPIKRHSIVGPVNYNNIHYATLEIDLDFNVELNNLTYCEIKIYEAKTKIITNLAKKAFDDSEKSIKKIFNCKDLKVKQTFYYTGKQHEYDGTSCGAISADTMRVLVLDDAKTRDNYLNDKKSRAPGCHLLRKQHILLLSPKEKIKFKVAQYNEQSYVNDLSLNKKEEEDIFLQKRYMEMLARKFDDFFNTRYSPEIDKKLFFDHLKNLYNTQDQGGNLCSEFRKIMRDWFCSRKDDLSQHGFFGGVNLYSLFFSDTNDGVKWTDFSTDRLVYLYRYYSENSENSENSEKNEDKEVSAAITQIKKRFEKLQDKKLLPIHIGNLITEFFYDKPSLPSHKAAVKGVKTLVRKTLVPRIISIYTKAEFEKLLTVLESKEIMEVLEYYCMAATAFEPFEEDEKKLPEQMTEEEKTAQYKKYEFSKYTRSEFISVMSCLSKNKKFAEYFSPKFRKFLAEENLLDYFTFSEYERFRKKYSEKKKDFKYDPHDFKGFEERYNSNGRQGTHPYCSHITHNSIYNSKALPTSQSGAEDKPYQFINYGENQLFPKNNIVQGDYFSSPDNSVAIVAFDKEGTLYYSSDGGKNLSKTRHPYFSVGEIGACIIAPKEEGFNIKSLDNDNLVHFFFNDDSWKKGNDEFWNQYVVYVVLQVDVHIDILSVSDNQAKTGLYCIHQYGDNEKLCSTRLYITRNNVNENNLYYNAQEKSLELSRKYYIETDIIKLSTTEFQYKSCGSKEVYSVKYSLPSKGAGTYILANNYPESYPGGVALIKRNITVAKGPRKADHDMTFNGTHGEYLRSFDPNDKGFMATSRGILHAQLSDDDSDADDTDEDYPPELDNLMREGGKGGKVLSRSGRAVYMPGVTFVSSISFLQQPHRHIVFATRDLKIFTLFNWTKQSKRDFNSRWEKYKDLKFIPKEIKGIDFSFPVSIQAVYSADLSIPSNLPYTRDVLFVYNLGHYAVYVNQYSPKDISQELIDRFSNLHKKIRENRYFGTNIKDIPELSYLSIASTHQAGRDMNLLHDLHNHNFKGVIALPIPDSLLCKNDDIVKPSDLPAIRFIVSRNATICIFECNGSGKILNYELMKNRENQIIRSSQIIKMKPMPDNNGEGVVIFTSDNIFFFNNDTKKAESILGKYHLDNRSNLNNTVINAYGDFKISKEQKGGDNSLVKTNLGELEIYFNENPRILSFINAISRNKTLGYNFSECMLYLLMTYKYTDKDLIEATFNVLCGESDALRLGQYLKGSFDWEKLSFFANIKTKPKFVEEEFYNVLINTLDFNPYIGKTLKSTESDENEVYDLLRNNPEVNTSVFRYKPIKSAEKIIKEINQRFYKEINLIFSFIKSRMKLEEISEELIEEYGILSIRKFFLTNEAYLEKFDFEGIRAYLKYDELEFLNKKNKIAEEIAEHFGRFSEDRVFFDHLFKAFVEKSWESSFHKRIFNIDLNINYSLTCWRNDPKDDDGDYTIDFYTTCFLRFFNYVAKLRKKLLFPDSLLTISISQEFILRELNKFERDLCNGLSDYIEVNNLKKDPKTFTKEMVDIFTSDSGLYSIFPGLVMCPKSFNEFNKFLGLTTLSPELIIAKLENYIVDKQKISILQKVFSKRLDFLLGVKKFNKEYPNLAKRICPGANYEIFAVRNKLQSIILEASYYKPQVSSSKNTDSWNHTYGNDRTDGNDMKATFDYNTYGRGQDHTCDGMVNDDGSKPKKPPPHRSLTDVIQSKWKYLKDKTDGAMTITDDTKKEVTNLCVAAEYNSSDMDIVETDSDDDNACSLPFQ